MTEYVIDKLEDLGLRKLAEMNIEQDEEIEKLHSIIKEVREYIEKRKEDNKTCSVCSVITDELLEILDKENK